MNIRSLRVAATTFLAASGLSILFGSTTNALFAQSLPADASPPAGARFASGTCEPDGLFISGAKYRICMPDVWNGDLIIYAHGYVTPAEPVAIPENQLRLPDGTYLPDLINSLGFAFATTSYRANGLAVEHGIEDVIDVANIFVALHGPVTHTLLAGVSEGGLITVLAIEQRPDVFDGGLAVCGPIGDFRGQVDYFGDFRVLFDYYFPGLMSGSPVSIPQSLFDNWYAHYDTLILPAISAPANAHTIDQLFSVSGAPRDLNDPASVFTSVHDALSYNALATNDAIAKLGGQPFGNVSRAYDGSDDDTLLNATVQRFPAGQPALDQIEAVYQTTGRLSVPLVTLHNTLDPQVPYWHEALFRTKVILNDSVAFHQNITVARYGHCFFTGNEVLGAFVNLLIMIVDPPAPFPSPHVYLPVVANSP